MNIAQQNMVNTSQVKIINKSGEHAKYFIIYIKSVHKIVFFIFLTNALKKHQIFVTRPMIFSKVKDLLKVKDFTFLKVLCMCVSNKVTNPWPVADRTDRMTALTAKKSKLLQYYYSFCFTYVLCITFLEVDFVQWNYS